MGGTSETQGRELAVGQRKLPCGQEDGFFKSSGSASFFFTLFLLSSLHFSISVSAPYSPRQETMPAVPKSPVSPPGSADLSSHMAERPRPGHSGAAAAGEEKHPRTECLSPFSRGRAHLQGGERSGLGPWRPLGHLPLPPQSVWGLT